MLGLVMQETESELVALVSWIDPEGADRPLVALIHGAFRSSYEVQHLLPALKEFADVTMIDLPGHGRSPPIYPATVENMTRSIYQALVGAFPDRQVLVVGESIGGLVALGLGGMDDPGPLQAVLALDPPFSVSKLWSVSNSIRARIAEIDGDPFSAALTTDVFGMTKIGQQDRIFYPLLGGLKVPTLIATGDNPPFPVRQHKGLVCLFDEVDAFVINTFYPGKVRLHKVTGSGHLLLTDVPGECLRLINVILANHVGPSNPGARS